jgi:hypothetical protein
MRWIVDYLRRVADELIGQPITVEIASDVTWPFAATFGECRLTLNLGRLGHKWFAGPLVKINDLALHEFAHHVEMNHLSSNYHRALTDLGARMTQLALDQPELFQLRHHVERKRARATVHDAQANSGARLRSRISPSR